MAAAVILQAVGVSTRTSREQGIAIDIMCDYQITKARNKINKLAVIVQCSRQHRSALMTATNKSKKTA